MSHSLLTKDKIDLYLKNFAKELKKETKKVDIDIIIVGGGAVVLNYGFRGMTQDLDIIKPNELLNIKNAANKIADKFDLPLAWLNDDFKTTASYSTNLPKYAKYYRTFSNHIHFYTIKDEYLIAMKLISARKYKFDYSDIVGVIKENEFITKESIYDAVYNLYGENVKIDKDIEIFLDKILGMPKEELDSFYTVTTSFEEKNKRYVLEKATDSNKTTSFNNRDDYDDYEL